MDRDMKKIKNPLHNNEGFTLVEVIAVLVILGILAAVAVPKFFDMQQQAREKAVEGAVGELNGQVALAFAQNALKGGTAGNYDGLPPDAAGWTSIIGTDFEIGGIVVDATTKGPAAASAPTIHLASDAPGENVFNLTWNMGDASSPGYFQYP